MLEMYRFGHALIELASSFAAFLETEVTVPLFNIVAGETVFAGYQTYELGEFLIGAGFITIVIIKIVKFIVSIVL